MALGVEEQSAAALALLSGRQHLERFASTAVIRDQRLEAPGAPLATRCSARLSSIMTVIRAPHLHISPRRKRLELLLHTTEKCGAPCA